MKTYFLKYNTLENYHFLITNGQSVENQTFGQILEILQYGYYQLRLYLDIKTTLTKQPNEL